MRSTSLFPFKINKLVSLAPSVFGTLDDLADRHTVLPSLSWTLSKSGMAEVADNFSSGLVQSMALRWLTVGSRYPRYCLRCAERDIEVYGIAYWRRINQLSFVAHCTEHDEPLMGGCGSCDLRSLMMSPLPLPSRLCACGRDQRPVLPHLCGERREPLRGMAAIASEMMRKRQPENLTLVCGAGIAAGMLERGFGFQGFPSEKRLQRSLESSGAMATLRSLDVRASKLRHLQRLYTGERWQNLGLRIAVIHHLFGNLKAYVDRCDRILNEPTLPKKAPPTSAEIEAARAKILAVANRLETRSRSAIRSSGITEQISICLTFDSDWYAREFPTAYSNACRPSGQSAFAIRDRDRAEEIRRRAQETKRLEGEPVWVTKMVVLSTTRSGVAHQVGPFTKTALNEVVESVQEYRARCVRWALANRDTFSSRTSLTMYLTCRMGPGAASKIASLRRAGEDVSATDMLVSRGTVGKGRRKSMKK